MIKLHGIEKYYANKFIKTFVLRNIDLEIEEGAFISIMGPSGAGKSTLLHIIGMLDDASDGEYYFYDNPVHAMKEKDRTKHYFVGRHADCQRRCGCLFPTGQSICFLK